MVQFEPFLHQQWPVERLLLSCLVPNQRSLPTQKCKGHSATTTKYQTVVARVFQGRPQTKQSPCWCAGVWTNHNEPQQQSLVYIYYWIGLCWKPLSVCDVLTNKPATVATKSIQKPTQQPQPSTHCTTTFTPTVTIHLVCLFVLNKIIIVQLTRLVP